MDWIFFQFKLDKTGHGLLIFGSYLDSFYLDMDFDPFRGVPSALLFSRLILTRVSYFPSKKNDKGEIVPMRGVTSRLLEAGPAYI